MSKSNIHPVSSTGIQTHGLLDVSLLPLPLDQGCSPKPDQLFKFTSIRFQTTRKGLSAIADLDNSRRTFLSSPRSNRLEQNSPTIRVRSFGSYEPSSPRSIPSVLLPSPGPEDRGYKEFKDQCYKTCYLTNCWRRTWYVVKAIFVTWFEELK